jgi:hypothetical protein
MTKLITSEDTQDLWHYMCQKYGTIVVNKASASEMRVIAAALSAMGIMDAKTFMKKYTTTIGDRIYPSFEIGDENGPVPLIWQVSACVHEHVHVRQFKEADFTVEYCLDSGKRTRFECEAYRASMEMEYWCYGKCSLPAVYIRSMKGYALDEEDIAYARNFLGQAYRIICKGGITTPETKVAIAHLKTRIQEV